MLQADNAQHEESVWSSVVCLTSVRVADGSLGDYENAFSTPSVSRT